MSDSLRNQPALEQGQSHQQQQQRPPQLQQAQQLNLERQAPPLEGHEGQHPNRLVPLGRDRFMRLLTEWWRRNGINPNGQMITIGNRQIDLYLLHTEVLQYGGVLNVNIFFLY